MAHGQCEIACAGTNVSDRLSGPDDSAWRTLAGAIMRTALNPQDDVPDVSATCVRALHPSFYRQLPSGIPIRRRIVMAGHQLVNADCKRLRPTNAVSRYHQGDTQRPRESESSTIAPANKRRVRSTVITTSHRVIDVTFMVQARPAGDPDETCNTVRGWRATRATLRPQILQ